MKVLLASGNPSKIARLRNLLDGIALEIAEPGNLGLEMDVPEPEQSILQNAQHKASAWARAARLPAVATDGGLEIPALGASWQAVLTKRAAGETASDVERASHLLALMAQIRGAGREACNVEAIALASADGEIVGSWESRGDWFTIARSFDPRGVTAGFWLPGLLEFPGGRRYGDLSSQEREAVGSHWLHLKGPLRGAVEELIRQSDT